ncbi:addiction module antidote protein [Sphingomonas sp. IW22]|uniref:addiction module antidote protein n=1 Tax=Sphingomonas sp. IW22 TaxID=3242489 RepID=UPI00352113C6
MTVNTIPFDAMAHLDQEDHIDLLNDALATGNSDVVIRIVGEIARARGMSNVARDSDLGRSTLYKALADNANPTISTFLRVLAALQIDLHAQRAGELETA